MNAFFKTLFPRFQDTVLQHYLVYFKSGVYGWNNQKKPFFYFGGFCAPLMFISIQVRDITHCCQILNIRLKEALIQGKVVSGN